jgi:hypothetical protein
MLGRVDGGDSQKWEGGETSGDTVAQKDMVRLLQNCVIESEL